MLGRSPRSRPTTTGNAALMIAVVGATTVIMPPRQGGVEGDQRPRAGGATDGTPPQVMRRCDRGTEQDHTADDQYQTRGLTDQRDKGAGDRSRRPPAAIVSYPVGRRAQSGQQYRHAPC